jgi:hypothetical protein
MPFAKMPDDFPWREELFAYDSVCASFDWFFYMTDDNRVYEKRLEQYNELKRQNSKSDHHMKIWQWHCEQHTNRIAELSKKTNPPQ